MIIRYEDIPEKAYYKDGEPVYLGGSDGATLYMMGFDKVGNIFAKLLNYGEDGDYSAYVMRDDGKAKIPEHYHRITTWYHKCIIVDDDGRDTMICGGEISIYRAGDFGTLIVVKEERK